MGRIYVIKDQWRMAVDYPFGTGHKGTTELSFRYIAEEYWSNVGGRSSHNSFMSALVDHGFLGFFIWCAMTWKLITKCREVVKWARLKGDVQLNWLAATIFGVMTVVWTGGMFAPFLKAEILIWMSALTCSLWADSIGRSTEKNLDQHSRATDSGRSLPA